MSSVNSTRLDDLIRLKDQFSARYLRVSEQSGVMLRRAPLRVAVAVAEAGSNVHAVGIGRKIVQGQPAGPLCLKFYVVQKLAPSLLPPRDLLPALIDGLPTDVVEAPPAFINAKKRPSRRHRQAPLKSPAGKRAGTTAKTKAAAAAVVPELHALAAVAAAQPACTTNRQSAQRPIVAGISVAHRMITAGTIGYFCRSTRPGDDPAQIHILSNNHVLADVNQATPGDEIYQPGPADGGTAAHHVAELTRYVTIQLGATSNNRVDAAIAAINASIQTDFQVCSIGRIAGTVIATEDMPVRKHGRTTGLTSGIVSDILLDTLVGMDHANPNIVARFTNQIRIEGDSSTPIFGLGGDSGSLVVAASALNAVGLYFAGPDSGTYGIANPIASVLQELQVSLV